MATKTTKVLSATTAADILNAIRNSASTNYRDYIPAASDTDSIREIGAIIMDYPALQNEFLHSLVNRIGRVLVTNKLYQNPLAMFKKGLLDYGESIEEIFVNIAKPFEYDPAVAESEVFKREIPDVRAAFHILNYQKFYKATVQQSQLKQAFLSEAGVLDLVTKITESMTTAANYDEFITTKYMIAKNLLNGRFTPITVAEDPNNNAADVVKVIRGTSSKIEFMRTDYNPTGVSTHTLKESQYLLINADFEAIMDIDVLATAFNMNKAEFMGHVVTVDSFGDLDNDRLNVLFANDPNYEEISDVESEALNTIPAVLVDLDYFMIFDVDQQFTEEYNPQGLYWNYFLHCWKVFSISPFANAVAFVPGTAGIEAVTITPDAVSIPQTFTGNIQLTTIVDSINFASKVVNYTIETDLSGYENLSVGVTKEGTVKFAHNGDVASYPSTIVIRATSVFDDTKYAECTITLVANA